MVKQVLSILLFLISFSSFSQVNDTIHTPIFDVVYSEDLQQPLWLRYEITCSMGSENRDGFDFYVPEGIKTSDDDDYYNNVWDKGHLAPAADFNCSKEEMKLTFSYLNCALQHQGLNRGPWKELEKFERDLAKVYDHVIVEVKVVFPDTIERVIGGAAIPKGFYKKIIFDTSTINVYIPNKDVSGVDWGLFLIKE